MVLIKIGFSNIMGKHMKYYKNKWNLIPEKIRFLITGMFGVFIGGFIYVIIYKSNPLETHKATTSWILAFLLAILRQHALHYFFTFTEISVPYLNSLYGAIKTYSFNLVWSTVLIHFLNEQVKLDYRISWFITVAISVPLSYILLKKLSFGVNKI